MTDFARAEHVVALTQQDTRGACANAAVPPAAEYGGNPERKTLLAVLIRGGVNAF